MLTIGRPVHPRWRRERVARLPQVFEAATARVGRVLRSPDLHPAQAPAAALVRGIGRMPVLDGNTVEFLPDFDATIDRLVADIEAAREHVHLLFYIFASDVTGLRVVAALERAAARGVTCRVLIDAIGSRPWAAALSARMRASGVTIADPAPAPVLSALKRGAAAPIAVWKEKVPAAAVAIVDGAMRD